MKIFCVGFHREGVEAFEFLAENYNVVGLMTLNADAANKRSGVFNFDHANIKCGLNLIGKHNSDMN